MTIHATTGLCCRSIAARRASEKHTIAKDEGKNAAAEIIIPGARASPKSVAHAVDAPSVAPTLLTSRPSTTALVLASAMRTA
jgi:hypothetical protein